MEFYLDSANYTAINKYVQAYNLKGVTCNPTIIIKDKANIKELANIVPKNKELFLQVISDEVNGIIEETKKLMALSENIIVKIPATANGLRAIKILKDESINTLATGIYSTEQALMAANCGAAYVAPYVNRIYNLEKDGIQTTIEINNVLQSQKVNCKVIAASFKNMFQVKELMVNGVEAVTIGIDLMERLVNNQDTMQASNDFINAWKSYTGENSLSL